MPWPRSGGNRFLLAALRRTVGSSGSASCLPASPDWERTLAAANRLDVAPLLYAALKSDPHGAKPPAAVMARLEEQYYRQAVLNAQLHSELARILTALSADAIPVILLKGAALAEPVYDNIALRPMQDLDLLVRTSDLEAADRVVRALGYLPDESYRPAAWYRDQHHHLAPYGASDGRTAVEIHRHILPPSAPLTVPIDALWERARPVVVASTPGLVFAPPDLLLHLCLDVSCVDRFAGKLRSLCDVAAVIKRWGPQIDWPALVAAARDYRAAPFVYYPLALARRLVGADVPAAVLRDIGSSIRRPSLADVALRVLTRLAVTRPPREAAVVPGWILARSCGDLLRAEGGREAIRALRPLDLLARAWRRGEGQAL